MPIYEFKCQACGTEIEVLQKISDPHITDCEACGESAMKKKVTAAAFRLSGAGWYETDFKEGEKKKNLTETTSEKKENSSGDASTSGDASKASKDGSDKSTDKSTDKATAKTETSTTDTKKPKKSKESSTD